VSMEEQKLLEVAARYPDPVLRASALLAVSESEWCPHFDATCMQVLVERLEQVRTLGPCAHLPALSVGVTLVIRHRECLSHRRKRTRWCSPLPCMSFRRCPVTVTRHNFGRSSSSSALGSLTTTHSLSFHQALTSSTTGWWQR
jgi:hypothetical protein